MSTETPGAAAAPLLLRGVTVVDTRDGSLSPDCDVSTADGIITAITPTSHEAPTNTSGRVVDARGLYVVPGFLDMHAHPLGEQKPTGALELMLANGITGFRQMSGSAKLLQQRLDGDLPMPADSPAVVALPGALLTPLNAGTAADAADAIRQQHRDGADFIKVGLVTPEVFRSAQVVARELGIPIVGHLPEGIDVVAASRAGVRCIEHLGPGVAILVACSTDQDGLARAVASLPSLKLPSVKLPFMEQVLTRMLRRIVVNPVARSKPESVRIRQRAIDTFDEGKATDLAARFAADGTWQCPTLIRVRTQQLCDATEFRDDPHLAYMAPSTVKTWTAVTERFAKLPPDARATFRAFYDLQLRLTKIFDNAGVQMLAGSDTVGAAWVVPGFSLHQEFDELARAGLDPLRILQMTTLDGAEFLGRTASMGTVEVGKNADLTLLAGNPVIDVANLHRVVGVVRCGRHYSTPDLDRIKDRVRTSNPAY